MTNQACACGRAVLSPIVGVDAHGMCHNAVEFVAEQPQIFEVGQSDSGKEVIDSIMFLDANNEACAKYTLCIGKN